MANNETTPIRVPGGWINQRPMAYKTASTVAKKRRKEVFPEFRQGGRSMGMFMTVSANQLVVKRLFNIDSRDVPACVVVIAA